MYTFDLGSQLILLKFGVVLDLVTIAKFIAMQVQEIRIGEKGRFHCGPHPRDTLRPDNELYRQVTKRLRNEDKTKLAALTKQLTTEEYIALTEGGNSSEFYDALFKAIEGSPKDERKTKGDVDLSQVKLMESHGVPLSEATIIRNTGGHRKTYVYYKDKGGKEDILDYETELVKNILEGILGRQGAAEYWATKAKPCRAIYTPYQTRMYRDPPDSKEENFNLWFSAPWRKGWKPDPNAKLHPEFKTYLDHFCPETKDKQQHFLLAWLRDCIFTRAQPILLLIGKAGVGKNIFLHVIAGALLGPGNHTKAQRSFKTTAYHANITRTQLMHLEEMSATKGLIDILKSYSFNDGIVVTEEKYMAVGKGEKMVASLVLSHNQMEELQLSPADRKFFAPDLGAVDLNVVWKEDSRREAFVKLFSDEGFLREQASFLYHYCPAGTADKFPKTAHYLAMCKQSLAVWERAFILACETKEEFSAKDLTIARHESIGLVKVQDFLRQYNRDFGILLGERSSEKGNKTWRVKSFIYVGENTVSIGKI